MNVLFLAPAPCCGTDVFWFNSGSGDIPMCDCDPQTSAPIDAPRESPLPALVGDIDRSGTSLTYGGVG